jgi:dihydrofolate reductase
MRNVVLLMHVSLDGFTAGSNGEMDWIAVDDEMWQYTTKLTDAADTALFGRVTYEMMEGYWPTAAEQPEATQHDIDHARWYNSVPKLVFSRTQTQVEGKQTRLVNKPIAEEIARLKQEPGKNLLMIGSTSLARTFSQLGLIDDYWLNVNPVALGSGNPLFGGKITLKLVEARTYRSGVIGMHYQPDRL